MRTRKEYGFISDEALRRVRELDGFLHAPITDRESVERSFRDALAELCERDFEDRELRKLRESAGQYLARKFTLIYPWGVLGGTELLLGSDRCYAHLGNMVFREPTGEGALLALRLLARAPLMHGETPQQRTEGVRSFLQYARPAYDVTPVLMQLQRLGYCL